MSELIPWVVALVPVCLSVVVAFVVLTDLREDAIVDAMRRLPSPQDCADDTREAGRNARRERPAA